MLNIDQRGKGEGCLRRSETKYQTSMLRIISTQLDVSATTYTNIIKSFKVHWNVGNLLEEKHQPLELMKDRTKDTFLKRYQLNYKVDQSLLSPSVTFWVTEVSMMDSQNRWKHEGFVPVMFCSVCTFKMYFICRVSEKSVSVTCWSLTESNSLQSLPLRVQQNIRLRITSIVVWIIFICYIIYYNIYVY